MSSVQIIEENGMNLDRANKLLAGIGDGRLLSNALYNALNRAGIKGRKDASSLATKEYVISKGTFDKHSKIEYHMHYGGGHLSGGVVSAQISFQGAVIPLIEFHSRFTRAGGVAVAVKRGGGGNLEHAFITRGRKYGVYERVEKSRLPIEELFGPSTAHMMQAPPVIEKMDKTIRDTFNERIDHEIDRILNGWG